ncbi:MAG: hypothetical protein WA981_11275 [Glaciecola sp.]
MRLNNAINTRSTICLVVLVCLTYTGLVSAKQTQFMVKGSGNQTVFSYEWQQQDKNYRLNFSILSTELYAMPGSPAAYRSALLHEYVYKRVMQAAQKIDPTFANINVNKKHDGLSFQVKSRNQNSAQATLRELEQAHEQAQNDYYSEHLFVTYKENSGQRTIRHDHAKYTALSHGALAPVVDAIKAIQQNPNNPREFVSIALSWIQNIPYNTLENRLSSNGAGFASPRDLIMQNKGDCDSKSTLLAAVLKAYNPNIDIQMVYLPEHALLAIGMRKLPKEMTISQKGLNYVLVEPTGPAQFAIGEVADSTKLALRNRQFDMVRL